MGCNTLILKMGLFIMLVKSVEYPDCENNVPNVRYMNYQLFDKSKNKKVQ